MLHKPNRHEAAAIVAAAQGHGELLRIAPARGRQDARRHLRAAGCRSIVADRDDLLLDPHAGARSVGFFREAVGSVPRSSP